MKTIFQRMPILLAAALFAAPAFAETRNAPTVFDKASCMKAVEDARKAADDAQVGDKTRAEIGELIRVSDHLCGQGNFVYAESMLQIARGMSAEE